ncbi:MAG: YqiJ family protein [Sphingomonadales bacterium]|nr:YqiJ family protein [Sphingomonadales bacterium]
MIDFWLADENMFFVAALVLMVAIGLLQLIGLGDFGLDLDTEVDGEVSGVADGLVSFLGIGRLPFLVILTLFLMLFALTGLVGQQLLQAFTGTMFTPYIAVPAAAGVALPLTGLLSRPLSRILPQDETTAVSIDELVGTRAVIEIGTAKLGYPARARASDRHRHVHFLMVEPNSADLSFAQGDEVLLVRRDGDIFQAVPTGTDWLRNA